MYSSGDILKHNTFEEPYELATFPTPEMQCFWTLNEAILLAYVVQFNMTYDMLKWAVANVNVNEYNSYPGYRVRGPPMCLLSITNI